MRRSCAFGGVLDIVAKRWLAERRVFVVLGAMKGGTSALRSHLCSLAWEDWMSLSWQEQHFFDDDEEFSRGVAYYASWFQWDESREPPWVVGDITPSYLYMPAALPRLRSVVPHAKLVVMLRNPIDRALSHHNHDLHKERRVGRLRERWECELAARRPPSRADVFGRGLYFSQLQRVLEHFPRKQLLVVISERYRQDIVREFRRVRSFLELSKQRLLKEDLPEEHVRGEYAEELGEADRRALRDLYAADVAALKAFLDDPLPEWRDFAEPVKGCRLATQGALSC